MIAQKLVLGHQWEVIIYYKITTADEDNVVSMLKKMGCKKQQIKDTMDVLLNDFDTGVTYTNYDYHTTFVCIAETTSNELFINTIVHEAKHILSHICNYYNISEDGEQAAYLIGYLILQMYKVFKNMLL